MVGSYLTEVIQAVKLVPNAPASITLPLLPGTSTRAGLRQPRRTLRIFLGN